MSTTRPTIDQSLIDKIVAIMPKYVTTNGFIHMLLEDAYNGCGLMKSLETLRSRQWTDPDIVEGT